ncbi:hypothetical protein HDU76_004149 [Blyttiomyces sp. JEL0837]|nr:hypothetical protein HDU76_004149 [Blyttiomyces sp. JEL0837]
MAAHADPRYVHHPLPPRPGFVWRSDSNANHHDMNNHHYGVPVNNRHYTPPQPQPQPYLQNHALNQNQARGATTSAGPYRGARIQNNQQPYRRPQGQPERFVNHNVNDLLNPHVTKYNLIMQQQPPQQEKQQRMPLRDIGNVERNIGVVKANESIKTPSVQKTTISKKKKFNASDFFDELLGFKYDDNGNLILNLEGIENKLPFALDTLEQQLTCSICLEVMVAPHTVSPCGHSYCGLNLIEDMIQQKGLSENELQDRNKRLADWNAHRAAGNQQWAAVAGGGV